MATTRTPERDRSADRGRSPCGAIQRVAAAQLEAGHPGDRHREQQRRGAETRRPAPAARVPISATLGQGEALTLASRMKHLIDPPRVLIFADAVDQHLACAASSCRRRRRPLPLCGSRGASRLSSGAPPRVKQQFPELQPSAIHALLDQVEDRDRAIVAMLLEHTPPDHIAGLLGLSGRSLELRRQGILKRLGPTCGVDDCRRDGREYRGPVATEGSRETRPSVAAGAPERKIVLSSDHRAPRLKARFAAGAQPPDPRESEHPEASPRAESRQQPQTSPASGLTSRAGLGSLAASAQRMTMSQPSRHTRYELTWSELAILASSVSDCCVSWRSASPSRCD